MNTGFLEEKLANRHFFERLISQKPIKEVFIVKKSFLVGIIALTVVMLAGLSLTLSGVQATEGWEPEEIIFINHLAPGGAIDMRIRPIASKMQELSGIPVIVENRDGAGGMVGFNYYVNQTPADGTYLAVPHQYAYSVGILRGGQFDIDDMVPITHYARINIGLIAREDARWDNFEEFIEYVKDNPRDVSIGYLVGGVEEIILDLFIELFDINVRRVGYDGGGPVRADLLGGHIDTAISGYEATLGRLGDDAKGLTLFSENRSSFDPELPTIVEEIEELYPDLLENLNPFMVNLANDHFITIHSEFKEQYPERFEFLANLVEKALLDQEIQDMAKRDFWTAEFVSPEEALETWEMTHRAALEFRDYFIED